MNESVSLDKIVGNKESTLSTCQPHLSAWLKTFMIFEQSLIFFLFVKLLKKMRDIVELSHPIFAIIHHEVIMCCVSSIWIVVILILSIWIYAPALWAFSYYVISSFGLQYHHVTWLTVTCMRSGRFLLCKNILNISMLSLSRYYMLIILPKTSVELDMTAWRRRLYFVVWFAQFLYFFLARVPILFIAMLNGFPKKPLPAAVEANPEILSQMLITNTIVLNIPDVFSIMIYLCMIFKLRTNVVQPENVQAPSNQPEDDPGYVGGIWVGDGNADGIQEEIGSAAEQNMAPNEPHEAKNVMKVLKWHTLSSMVDLILIFFSSNYCTETGKSLSMTFQIFCNYYIPYFVLTKTFTKLSETDSESSSCSCHNRLLCCS